MWLYVPKTSSRSAPEAECSTSPSDALCQRLAQSVTWRGRPRQHIFWRNVSKRAAWTTRLFGRICEPSMANRGVAAWMASLEESPAKDTASPASGDSPRTTATCGMTSGEPFAKWAPDGSTWRTSQACLFPTGKSSYRQASHGYSESWPKHGGLRNGCVFERPKWAPTIGESGCSSWPAVRVARGDYTRDGGKKGAERMALEGVAKQWPTMHGLRPHGAETHAKNARPLNEVVSLWMSPKTPTGGGQATRKSKGGGLRKLEDQIQAIYSPPVPVISPHGSELSPTRRILRPRLNPAFVCWMMGWPWWWTNPATINSDWAATEWSRYRRLLRSMYCEIVFA